MYLLPRAVVVGRIVGALPRNVADRERTNVLPSLPPPPRRQSTDSWTRGGQDMRGLDVGFSVAVVVTRVVIGGHVSRGCCGAWRGRHSRAVFCALLSTCVLLSKDIRRSSVFQS